ncbi:glycoside hydrolase family 75 protein [Aquabacter spiritensis]|uniref:Chitosanase (Glycosyl hydrolase group 75) n=1 Tax=Aquabacter spiritensis TaxID=933073 RepID=A0A4R3LRJ8_9HYPH|nr:glycoside hydrolase family 75 protein [Aquabacter spiritensis]TCT02366.1 chitosanase (glycosyl hydrolase group 75) [Aquabacter spiritensis]
MVFSYWQTYQGTDIFRDESRKAYSYKTSYVSLDADGTPRAYHPDNTGLDDLANAGYPHKGWRGVLVTDPADPARPLVREGGPYAGYFISKTSLHDPDREETDPLKYVDSETIPYIVLPGAFYAQAGTGYVGNLALARRSDGAMETAAIIADIGPPKAPLGEMSLRLATALGGTSPNPRTGKGAPKGEFEYIVFPRAGKAFRTWPRSAAEISEAARALLDEAGGWPVHYVG